MKPSTTGMLILAGVLVLLGFTFLRAIELDRAAYVGLICGAVLGGINILLGYKVTGLDIRDYPFAHPNFEFIRQDILQWDPPP